MLQLGMLIICALATCQRDQTIKFLNLDYIKIPIDKIVLFVPKTLKTTKQDHHLPGQKKLGARSCRAPAVHLK